jgi:hypothetical protein
MKAIKIILSCIAFILLTIVTQVGGFALILSLLLYNKINRISPSAFLRTTLNALSFIILYLIFTFIIIPPIAKVFGRVAMPIKETNHVKPLTFLTCLLNRHYVRPELKQATFSIAEKLHHNNPSTVVNYLDGNFPFINNFPLLPHLSHNDGKKLDLAFYYIDNLTGLHTNESPSFIGYGICEDPLPHEENKPAFCKEKGYWQYSFLTMVVSQKNKLRYKFDEARTKELLMHLISNEKIGKIFLEPHLKTRMKLQSNKIRFHGCQAVRHDDHIHIQLKN